MCFRRACRRGEGLQVECMLLPEVCVPVHRCSGCSLFWTSVGRLTSFCCFVRCVVRTAFVWCAVRTAFVCYAVRTGCWLVSRQESSLGADCSVAASARWQSVKWAMRVRAMNKLGRPRGVVGRDRTGTARRPTMKKRPTRQHIGGHKETSSLTTATKKGFSPAVLTARGHVHKDE